MSEEVNRPDNGGGFINLWKLLVQIGKAETAYVDEAARYLVSCLDSDPTGMNYICRRDKSGIVLQLDLGARLHLMRQLSIFASQGTLFDADDRPTDGAQTTFERVGFYASDIYPYLARHDVAVSRPDDDDSEGHIFPDGRRIPGWILAYEDQDWISRRRAAKILLAGTNDAELSPSQYDEAFFRWYNALSDPIERGRIALTNVPGKQMLAHADIRAWCAQHGYVWPLEAPEAQPADMLSAVLSQEQQAPNVSLAPASSRDDASKRGWRERQIEMIKEAAEQLGYQRLQIPDGGKKEIHKLCHSLNPHLFTANEETFNGIWKDALATNTIRMAKHKIYARR